MRKLLFIPMLLLWHLLLLAQSPTYILDFEKDRPSINTINDQQIQVQGNVLLNDGSGEDAGFDYIINLSITGGPSGDTPIPFKTQDNAGPAIGTAASKFDFEATSIDTCGGDLALCYAFMGREGNLQTDYVYLRDPSSSMRFALSFDNDISMENVTYTLGDMDYNFIGTSNPCVGIGDLDNYNCRFSYIDQIQVISGQGSNQYTFPDPSMIHQPDTDLFYGKFPDANNNQRPDAEDDGRILGAKNNGNIIIYNPNNIGKQILFDYNDPGFAIEGDTDNYHDFDSYNQVMSFLTGMTFDEVVCSLSDIEIQAQEDSYPYTLLATATTNDNRTLSYQWQISTTNCEEGFQNIEGATLATYTPSTLSNSAYYRVQISEQAGAETVCTDFSTCVPFNNQLGGCIYDDLNLNLEKEEVDLPLNSVTIELYYCSSMEQPITSVTTDAEGNFQFTGLPDGSYAMRILPPDGYTIPFPSSINEGGFTTCYAVADGAMEEDCSILLGICQDLVIPTTEAMMQAGTSTCMVIPNSENYEWSPTQGISCLGCEEVCFAPPISTQYTATWKSAAAYNCNQTHVLSIVVTNPPPPPVCDMELSLTEATIRKGEEVCVMITSTGNILWEPSEDISQVGNIYCLSPEVSTTYAVTSTAPGCEETVDVKITVLQPRPATVGDFVFEDLNKDGFQDEGELGIANVRVQLQDEENNILQTTLTDKTGHYLFTIADPSGKYKVKFITPENYEPTHQSGAAIDNHGKDSDNDPTSGITGDFPIEEGDEIHTIDAGFIQLTSPPPLPPCQLTADITETDIYLGQEACVTIVGGTDLSISPATNAQATSGTTFCLTPTETTTYTITSTNPNCNELQIEVRVWNEVNSDCIAVDKTETDIYRGETACVEVSGIGGYVWTPNTNITKNGDSYCFSPTETTTYTLRSTIAGCDEERQVEVRVWNELANDCVAVDITQADIHLGEQACVTVSGVGGYVWTTSIGNPVTDFVQNGSTYCFSPSETTTYIVSSTVAGCTAEKQVTIRIWQEASIPTMSEWGLIIFGLLILNLSILLLYRQERVAIQEV